MRKSEKLFQDLLDHLNSGGKLKDFYKQALGLDSYGELSEGHDILYMPDRNLDLCMGNCATQLVVGRKWKTARIQPDGLWQVRYNIDIGKLVLKEVESRVYNFHEFSTHEKIQDVYILT
jgi:hypothetical protein